MQIGTVTLLQSALLNRNGCVVSISLENKTQNIRPPAHTLEKVFGAESFENFSTGTKNPSIWVIDFSLFLK